MFNSKKKYILPSVRVFDLLTLGQFSQFFLFGGGKGGGSAAQDTRMERTGTSTASSRRVLPDSLRSLVDSQLGSTVSGPSADAQVSLGQIVRRENETNPGYSSMKSQASIDPYSSDYAQLTDTEYNQRLADALAVSRSGETNVLAPISRGQNLREAEVIRRSAGDRGRELREARTVDSGIQQGATQNVAQNVIDAGRVQSSSADQIGQSLLRLGDLLGQKEATTVEDVRGRGAQSSSAGSWSTEASLGGMCCWIFLEAYRGVMPWWVRKCRDKFAPESSARRNGYRRMANWLVPVMQKSKLARKITLALMIKPLELWGGYHMKVPNYRMGWIFYPAVKFWFKTWEQLGKEK